MTESYRVTRGALGVHWEGTGSDWELESHWEGTMGERGEKWGATGSHWGHLRGNWEALGVIWEHWEVTGGN